MTIGLKYSHKHLRWLKHSNRLLRYVKSIIGILRYGDYRRWHPLMRMWNIGKWQRRYWYVGFQPRPKPPNGAIVSPSGNVLQPIAMGNGIIFIPWIEPYRTNAFSRWVNKYWDRLHAVKALRY